MSLMTANEEQIATRVLTGRGEKKILSDELSNALISDKMRCPFSVAVFSSVGVRLVHLTCFYIPPLKMPSQDSALPLDFVFHGA